MAAPFIFAASLAVLAAAPPESPMVVANKMNSAYKKAFLAKDYGYFVTNSTKDFTYTVPGRGTATREAALAELKGALQSFKKVGRFDVKVVSARRAKGGVLFITDTSIAAEVSMGEKVSKLVSSSREETLVVPLGKGWAYKHIHSIKDHTTIDGKPMKM